MRTHETTTSRIGSTARRRGVALILVMGALAIIMVVAMTFIAQMSTSVSIADNIRKQPPARHIAESGLVMAIHEIKHNDTWRTDHVHGQWVSDHTYAGGKFSVWVEDEIDSDLADDVNDPVVVTSLGRYKGIKHEVSVEIRPSVPQGDILMVVPNAAALTAMQVARQALLQQMGFGVSLISHTASQAAFDTAMADVQAVYVVRDVTDSSLGTKLTSATKAVVSEARDGSGDFVDELELARQIDNESLSDQIKVLDNSHYITSVFSTGTLTILNTPQRFARPQKSKMAPGAQILAERGGHSAVAAFEAGSVLENGLPAAARRVLLSWGDSAFDVTQFNADGRTLLKRALRWGVLGGPAEQVGNPAVGSSSQGSLNKKQVAFQVNVPEAGTLTSISIYIDGIPPKKARFGVYSDSFGEPNTLLAESVRAATKSNKFEWFTLDLPPTPVPAGPIWIAFSMEHGNQKIKRTSSGGQIRIKNYNAQQFGYLLNWGSSDASRTWKITAFASVIPDSKTGAPGLVSDFKVRWLEQP